VKEIKEIVVTKIADVTARSCRGFSLSEKKNRFSTQMVNQGTARSKNNKKATFNFIKSDLY